MPSVWRLTRRRFAITLLLFAIHAQRAHSQARTNQPVLRLRGFLDSVRAGYPALRAANSRVLAAEGSRTTARAFGNPVLSYQVDQTPFPGGRPLVGMEREAMTTATLPLEFLYQRGPKIARANAEVRAVEADAFATRQRVALDAAAAFYKAGVAGIQSAVSHDLLAWLDTLVSYNRARAEEGVTAEADLIRSELERDRVAAETAMQDADLAVVRAALGAYVQSIRSQDASTVIAVDDAPFPLSGLVEPQAQTDSSMSVADARPEVRAARNRLAALSAAISAERSMIVRQLGATIGTMQTGHMTSMIAGVSLPLPLLDQNRGEVQRARAERDVAAFELAIQERMAAADLEGAREAARLLTERAVRLTSRDSTSFLARADESKRIALGAYREGAVPLFQVIEAARSWSEARMAYYRTIAAQQQSILNLLLAQGRDLFTDVPQPASAGGSAR